MGNSIIVVKKDGRIVTCLANEKELLTIQVDPDDDSRLVGSIFLGKVQNIVKNIHAAFVEIENRQICYLPLGTVTKPYFSDSGEHPIRVGDELMVQIVKEATDVKAPLATADITLTGKYLVLAAGSDRVGVSAKITDEEKRGELKDIIAKYQTDEYGFIVRTNAGNADAKLIEREAEALTAEFEKIKGLTRSRTCYSKLYTAPPSYIFEIRNGYSESTDRIRTDAPDIYRKIKEYMEATGDPDINKLELYQDEKVSLSTIYNINSQLEKALKQTVWMNSGAYLVIQPTEALVSIDVNTGKAITGKQDTENTFFKVNCEAAEEIGRQLRLRNLSGIIIVDFIDMKSEEHKRELMARLKSVLERDSVPVQVVDMTALNLVEITRKKIRRPLYEQIKDE